MTRSLLFVPGDSGRKFDHAAATTADALILDLEDSVAPDQKPAARAQVRAMLERGAAGKPLWVRINALDSGAALADLASVMPAAPTASCCPNAAAATTCDNCRTIWRHSKPRGTPNRARPESWPSSPKPRNPCSDCMTTAMPRPAFGACVGRGGSGRGRGRAAQPRSRPLCRAFPPGALALPHGRRRRGRARRGHGLRRPGRTRGAGRRIREAFHDGFVAKMAVHPRHIAAINLALTPDDSQLRWARAVIAAFAETPAAGALRLDGKMIDRPHLRLARRLLKED